MLLAGIAYPLCPPDAALFIELEGDSNIWLGLQTVSWRDQTSELE